MIQSPRFEGKPQVTPIQWSLAICLWLLVAGPVTSQDFGSHAPPQQATSAERLMMEQVADLILAGEFGEALSSLQKLYDQGGQSIVATELEVRAATLHTQRYIPLRQWCQDKTQEILAQQPSVRDAYLQQLDGLAAAALQGLQSVKDPVEAIKVARRYRLTSVGHELTLLAADLCLERGWSLAAIANLERVTPEMRYENSSPSPAELPTTGGLSLAGAHAWSRAADEAQQQRLLAAWQTSVGRQQPVDDVELVAALERLAAAAAVQPKIVDRGNTEGWIRGLASLFVPSQRERLLAFIRESSGWQQPSGLESWTTFAGNPARSAIAAAGNYDLAEWPAWSQQLERYTASSDRIAASRPRVGETEQGTLAYHPVLAEGKVFINEMNRIRAYDLETGKALHPARLPLGRRSAGHADLRRQLPVCTHGLPGHRLGQS